MSSVIRQKNKRLTFLLYIGLFFSFGIAPIFAQTLQDQARIQYYKSMLEKQELSFSQRASFYDSITNYYQKHQDLSQTILYKIEKIKFYYNESSYLDAYKTGIDILNLINQKKELDQTDIENKTYAHLIIAKCCSNLGMFDEGISNLLSILKYPDNPYTVEAYSHLGYVFMQMDQMEKSRTYNYMALESLLKADSTIRLRSSCKVYNNLAGYYYVSSQLDSALYYLNQSIDYYDHGTDVNSKAYIYHNMAIIYQKMEEDSMAEDYFKIAIELSENDPYRQALYLQSLGDLSREGNRMNDAENYYYQALEIANEINSKQVKSNVLLALSKLYYSKHQYKKACEYMEQGVVLKDSVFSNENIEKIAILTQQFDNERITFEKELLEKQLQLERYSNQRKIILLSIFILILIGISVITFFQIRRVARKSLIHMAKEKRKEKETIQKEYEGSLDEKNRKLASNALFLMRTNEMLENLQFDLKQLSFAKDAEKRKTIIDEIESILKGYNANQGWDEFKYYFEQVHPSFYINLNKANPKLTKMEQRLCALLVLNMNTKEIAQVTNRSVRTVESLIYRLRKDLNIPSEEKTMQYLRQFLD